MRLLERFRRHKTEQDTEDDSATATKKIPAEPTRKRLYVQCNSMVNEQYTEDRALGKIVYINDEEQPILIDNEHFVGRAVFRVRDFDGWTPYDAAAGKSRPAIPHIKYFDGHKRAFSIQMSGRFKKEWTADDVLFGTWFDHKLILPRGYSLALAFAHQVDRSMTYEVEGDRPYMCSPLICAMNVINCQRADEESNGTTPKDPKRREPTLSSGLSRWRWRNGTRLEENLLATWTSWPTGPTESFHAASHPTIDDDLAGTDSKAARHRRNWFLDVGRRRRFRFHPDLVYSWDFFSPYVDVNRMQLRLGLTIDMSYYLDGQPLKYQARTRDGGVVFFEFVVGLA